MKITTDEYMEVSFYEDTFPVKMNVYEKLKDFINKHGGEFLNDIPDYEGTTSIRELIDKLRTSDIPYYIIDSHNHDIIPEGYKIICMETDNGTIVIIGEYDSIKLIGKLPESYEFADPLYLTTRFFVVCGDYTVEVVNDGYDYYSFILNDGKVVTQDDPEYDDILNKLKNCDEIYFGTVDI